MFHSLLQIVWQVNCLVLSRPEVCWLKRMSAEVSCDQTSIARVDQGGRVLQSNDREIRGGGFIGRRALRVPWRQVVCRRTIVKGVCGCPASVVPALG